MIPEKIVKKRENTTEECYEFLVQFEGLSRTFDAWMKPKDIQNPGLIQHYEATVLTEIAQKTHIAAWYPFKEDFAVQWLNLPYFAVSYGGGQLNKFCIVGFNKDKSKLVCKDATKKENPRHQAHVILVDRLLQSKGLVAFQGNIITEAEKALIISSVPSLPETTGFSKPISKTRLSLIPSTSVQEALKQQLQNPQSVPMEFKPKNHPEKCKCVLENGDQGQYKTSPEILPGKASGHCVVWLLYEQLNNRTQYYWRCMQNNPACDVFYNGAEDGFLTYSSTTIVSHAVPLDFILQLVTGKGASFAGFIAHKELMNIFCFGEKKECAYMGRSSFIKVNKGCF